MKKRKVNPIKLKYEKLSEKCLNSAEVIVVSLNLKGKISLINKKGCNLLGYKEKELIGKNWFNTCLPKNEKERVKKEFNKIISGKVKKLENFENLVITKKGEIKEILWFNTILKDNSIKIIGTTSCGVDITKSKKIENDSMRVSRALRMISSVNKMLITVTNEKTLLDEVCRIAVDVGGYKLAWIGFKINNKEKSIQPVASVGIENKYIEKAKLTWANTKRGRGPGGMAVRTGKTIIINDISKDNRMLVWRKEAIKRGYNSVIGLPLIYNKNIFGVILIYSRYVNVFCKEEIKILNELAKDLSFGISTNRDREEMLKLKSAVKTSGEVVYMTNLDGIITYINSEFTNLYGYTSSEVVNNVTPRILKSGLRTKEDYVNLWKNLLAGKITRDEHINKSKDGQLITVESTSSPIFDNKNNIIGFLAIQRDITKNKIIETKLRENEQLVSNVNSIMLKWKPDNTISFINNYGSKFFGYKKNELVGKNVNILVPKKESTGRDLKFLINNITKYPKKFLINENENINKKGERFWFAWTNKALKDINGNLVEILAVGSDITELKKAEEALKEYGERFFHLFEKANDSIWLIDKDTFIDCNNQAIKLFHCKNKKELINHTPMDFSPIRQPDGQNSKVKALKYINLVNEDHPQRFYWQHKTKDGILIDVEISLNKLFFRGKTYIQAIGRDVTKKKKAEDDLRESKERFKNIFDYSAIGVSLLSTKGRWLEVNSALCKITGYSRKELLSDSFNDITYKEDIHKGIEATKKLLSGKINHSNFDKRYIHKNGHIIWVNLSITLVKNSENKPLYFVTHTEDITFRKEAEIKLKEKEQKFRIIFESSPFGMFMYELNSKKELILLDSNNAADKILRFNNKLLIGKTIQKAFPNLIHTNIIKEYKKVLSTGQGWHDYKVKYIEHGVIWYFDVFAFKIPPNRLVTTFIDISDRVYIEKKSQESEQKFRRLFEAAKDSILLLNANTGEITDSNPFIQNLLGYSAQELIGSKIYEISPFKDIIKNKIKFLELQKKGYVYYDNLPLKTKDGIIKQVEFVSNVYLVADKKVIQCNIRDITERIKKEKELDLAKSDFLSMTSHQLRTPLSATKWVLEAIGQAKNFTPKQKERFGYLVDSNERLIYLINDLLDVTRIESGKLLVNKKLTNLNKLVNDLSQSLKILTDKKNKNIKISVPKKLKNIICDPILIHEALQNLLNNALTYSPEDSKDITISIKERESDYVVSVHNDGFIDSVTSERIKVYDKFIRGIGASEIQPAGSGLGIYIAKKVIEANGGTLWFESNLKHGTTFYFTIIKNN